MVIVLKKNISEKDKSDLKNFLLGKEFKLNEVSGEEDTILAAVGKLSMNADEIEKMSGVEKVIPISRPYKMASREFRRENTVVGIPTNRNQIIRVGGKRIVAIAGPCAVESREQIMEIAESVASSGAVMLSGRAFRPRTSPYAFQGTGEEGLRYLREAGDEFGLPVVSEIITPDLLPVLNDYVDVFQIGSRNMQDFDLLRKVGAMGKPVILKRGYTSTLEEFLMSAEYLLASGTDDVILCERGIRTFEHATRNTLDLSAIPVLRGLTHLPVIVDPSHALGHRELVQTMGLAAIASGADGIMVDVHNNPSKALAGGAASLLPEQFDKMMHDIEALAPVMGKSVSHIRNVAPVKLTCAYNGKRGAYAEQAVARYFDGENVEAVAVKSFGEIFQNVVDGKCDYGMIPIENSLAGSVYQNYDNFSRFEDVTIVGAVTLNIRHTLLCVRGTSIDDIRTVYSHPQALGQCKKFLERHKDWVVVDSTSTSDAAKFVSETGCRSNAAIASSVNAGLYGLDILAEDIENDPSNFTRFVVIRSVSRQAPSRESNVRENMASFIIKTKNEPGALYRTLGIFNDFRVNLTRLESRPFEGEPWNYWFYADAELPSDISGCSASEYVGRLRDMLRENAEDIRVLGVYFENRNRMNSL